MKGKPRTFKISQSLLTSGLATAALSMGCIFLTESTQTVNPGPVPEEDMGRDMSVIVTNPGPVDMPRDLQGPDDDMPIIVTNPGPVDMPRDLQGPFEDMTPPVDMTISPEDMTLPPGDMTKEEDMPIIIINPGPIDMKPDTKLDLGAIDPGKLPDMP